eukprot:SAG31_NODE_9444_length_1276_cov_1.565845_1_plen_30_part_10
MAALSGIFYKSMVLVGGTFFHFCDPTSLEK